MKIIGLEDMSGADLSAELEKGGKFVVYQYCISILVMTFKRSSNIYFVSADENPIVKGLLFTVLSFFLGWWGIPWGPIYTIEAFIVNFKGGRDVTAEIIASFTRADPPNEIRSHIT